MTFGSPPPGSPPGGYGPPPGGNPPTGGGYGSPNGFPTGGQPYGSPQGTNACGTPGSGGLPPGFYPPEDVEPGKLWAILGQLIHPLWIVPLITRDNAFAVYHSKQALVLALVSFASSFILAPIAAITCGFGAILYLIFLYPLIMGIVNAANGRYAPMPLIGGLADTYLSGIVADRRPGAPGRM